jgi:hypothetical protein
MSSTPRKLLTAEERIALIQVKIERANKHIIDLNAEIKAFFDSKPYKIGAERDPQTRRITYKLIGLNDVPSSVATLTGDAIQNLRSALDHLVQQLWLVNHSGVTSTGDVTFPTDSSPAQFKANAPGKVKGLRQDAIDAIYRIEPYDRGKGADLSVLNRLNRIDKHRLLILGYSKLGSVNVGSIMTRVMQEGFNQAFPGRTLPKFDLWIRPADTSPLKIGSALFTDAADAEVNKNMKFQFVIALYEPGIVEGEPLLPTLKKFHDLVSSTVMSFKPYLS